QTASATNPGQWSNNLQVAVTQLSPTDPTFDLFVRGAVLVPNKPPVILNTETYRNLTMSKGDRAYCVDVVTATSQLVTLTDAGLGMVPASSTPTTNSGAPEAACQSLGNGDDGNAFDSAGNLTTNGKAAMVNALLGD